MQASVVVVLTPDDPHADATVAATMAAVPASTELIVVVNGAGAPDATAAERWPDARIVDLGDTVPFGAAANRGAAAAVGRVLCFVPAGTMVSPGWLPPLMAAVEHERVGCAVPRVSATDGRLLEAGCARGAGGAVVAIGAGSVAASFEHSFPRRTDGGSRGCFCVRRSSFVAAGGFDPALESLLGAGMDLARVLRGHGLGTVYEPASRVVVASAARRAGVDEHDVGSEWSPLLGDDPPADRILVVARSVPFQGRTHAERRVSQLLSDLSAIVPDGRLTLLALDGRHARRSAPRLLRQGIEVVAGPEDWEGWLRRRSLTFSHIVVTDLPGLRRLDGPLHGTQPQAVRILCLPSLDFEDVLAAHPGRRRNGDAAGAGLVVGRVREQLIHAAEGFDAAWCATPHDRKWMAATVPDIRCAVLPTAATPGPHVPFDQRSGYVVLAMPGADVTAGHEDAARHAATEVFPSLLAREPGAFLRVVVDDPSPALQLLAGPNIELVPGGRDPARWFRRSRVCLACYPRGTGSREAVTMAIDARTPLVTYHPAVAAAAFGRLRALVEVGDPLSASLRAEELHGQSRLWEAVHSELVRLAEGPSAPSAARLKLVRACADVGIAPTPGAPLAEPIEPGDAEDDAPLRPRNVAAVGSAWNTAPPAPDGPVPPVPPPRRDGDWTDVPVDDQYARWCALYGPTPDRLARLGVRLRGLVRRPRFSIVMPVFNTEPSWLNDAISSVRAQVYENWELCIGDDGSVDQGTIEALERHQREEPRIRLIRLPGRQGIAAASNAALSLATGRFVGFLDHDDELKPHALGEIALLLDDQPDLDVVYTDEDKRDADGRLVDPFFKPDWSPDHLMSRNYVCHFLVLRRSLIEKLGGFRTGYDGSQDYDLVLRATESTTRIAHVHEPLYTWRKALGSTAGEGDAKPWALDAARRALDDALDRRGTPGRVVDGMHPGTTYRVRYALRGRPKVSILIPTRDRLDLLRTCIDSIRERSTYTNYEIVVVDNESGDADMLAYLAGHAGRVVRYPHRFNYSRMMNLAAHEADGDLLLFLNNDTRVLSPEWLEALVEHGQRPDVGVVGPRLRYPGGRPQHEGTIVGYKGGHAGNVDHAGYWSLGDIVRNCSAVTGACLLMRPSVYWELGGHDERLRVAFNDVDLCLRARQAGYEVVYTPYAELSHVEGGTRGIHAHLDDDAEFEAHWVTHKCRDPYYNSNFERLYPFRLRG